MSRPDAIHFRNTNQLSTRDFVPSRLMYHGIPRWVGMLLFLQCAIGSALWLALQTGVARHYLPGLIGQRAANIAIGVGVHPAISFAASQATVMFLLQLTAVPLIRR